MKRYFLILILLSCIAIADAQSWVPVDKSPMDQIYYPVDYPYLKVRGGTKEPVRLRVIYSRPFKNGREVFGGTLVPYGEVWRLGANEATEIEFFTPVVVKGKTIPKGRYTLYAIVTEKDWTYIINKDTDVWGAFKYDKAKDLLRATVPINTISDTLESLTIDLKPSKKGVELVTGWDNKSAALLINFLN